MSIRGIGPDHGWTPEARPERPEPARGRRGQAGEIGRARCGEPSGQGRAARQALRAAFAATERSVDSRGGAQSGRGNGFCGETPGRGLAGLKALLRDLEQLLRALEAACPPCQTPRPPCPPAEPPAAETPQPGDALRRLLPADYADGAGAMAGADRPSAREISNAVSADTGKTPEAGGPTDMFWAFGQFLDHDIDLTRGGAHGSEASETAPIAVPGGDPTFDPDGEGGKSIPFTRSAGIVDENGVRQQVNEITALIDASNIYGSTEEETDALRAHEGGKLAMGDVDHWGLDNLPKDGSGRFYVAGDVRANENSGLTALHMVFAREHNRLAEEIAAENPDWTDDQIFDQARAMVTAELQAVTLNEFLPLLLGEGAMGAYQGYTGVDAQISNSFATAAFRFGHSLVSDSLLLIDDDGARRSVTLAEAFFNPGIIEEHGIEDVLRGLAEQKAQPLDTEIVDSLRNMVLPDPNAPPHDLAALNIQRGRDHGLPGLNDARAALGLDRLSGFDDPRLRDGAGERLALVYDSIDEVDLWVGMLAEAPIGDGLVGETQRLVLLDQFDRLRHGDPDWYEGAFPAETVAALNALRLSDIIERNAPTGDLQDAVMRSA